MYVMAIDAGTGSCRALIFDAAGALAGGAQRDWTHDAEEGVPGSMSFAVERNRTLVLDLVREALRDAGVSGRDVAAVSATSMREGIVVLDRDGHEIWACANVDARAGEEVAILAEDGALEETIYRRTGQTFALAAQPRLLWVKRHRPDLFERAATVLMLSEWVLYVLSGESVMEPTNGSTSGLLDLSSRQADDDLLTLCDLPGGMVPTVVEPGTPIGTVRPEAADQTGLASSCIVVAGGGDAQMATLGAGLTASGQAMVIAGTFWQQEVNIPEPVTDADMRVRVNAAPLVGTWQAEAIAFHAGTAMRWFRDTFCAEEVALARGLGQSPFDVLTAQAAEIPIGSDGVIPIFSDRMNYRRWRHAAPSFLGLNLDGGPRLRAAMFRSLMENAAIVADANLSLVTEFSGVEPDEVVFAGGSAKSETWTQIVADVIGKPLRIPEVTEATAQGAAACAAAGAGWGESPAEIAARWVAWGRHVTPSDERHEQYRIVKERWRRAYAAQRELMEEGITTPMWQAPGTSENSVRKAGQA